MKGCDSIPIKFSLQNQAAGQNLCRGPWLTNPCSKGFRVRDSPPTGWKFLRTMLWPGALPTQSFQGHRRQSCLFLLSLPMPPPSSFILPRGKKCDVREITIWPQKTRNELLLCYFLALWTSAPPAHLRNVFILLCVPERIAERTCERTNRYHSRHDPCLTPRLKSLHFFLSLVMSIAFR